MRRSAWFLGVAALAVLGACGDDSSGAESSPCEAERPAAAGEVPVALEANLTVGDVVAELDRADADSSAWGALDVDKAAARCEYDENGTVALDCADEVVAFYVTAGADPIPVPRC